MASIAEKSDGKRRVQAPDLQTMRRWRQEHWAGDPLAESLPGIQALLMIAPRAAEGFVDIHAVDTRQRIVRVIGVCSTALSDRPELALHMRSIVPVLAKEKLRRNGVDPDSFPVAALSPRANRSTPNQAC